MFMCLLNYLLSFSRCSVQVLEWTFFTCALNSTMYNVNNQGKQYNII